jgi:hypothetical protein
LPGLASQVAGITGVHYYAQLNLGFLICGMEVCVILLDQDLQVANNRNLLPASQGSRVAPSLRATALGRTLLLPRPSGQGPPQDQPCFPPANERPSSGLSVTCCRWDLRTLDFIHMEPRTARSLRPWNWQGTRSEQSCHLIFRAWALQLQMQMEGTFSGVLSVPKETNIHRPFQIIARLPWRCLLSPA